MVEETLPSIMGDFTDEERTARAVQYAKYFTVIQYIRGGFQKGGTNHIRNERPTLESARELAEELRAENSQHTVIIYAVADFAGCRNFSRPVEFWPKSQYVTRAEKAQIAKEERRKAREAEKAERLATKAKPAVKMLQTAPQSVPENFYDAETALGYVGED